MGGLHGALGIAVLAANGLAGVWGGIAWLRSRPSQAFWFLLRAAQAVVVVEVVVGAVLLAQGRPSPSSLHLVYGIAPLVIALVS